MYSCIPGRLKDNTQSNFLLDSAATCDKLFVLSSYKNPPKVIYPNGKLTYGTEVTLQCSVDGGETSERKRRCLYDVAARTYQFIGDSLECGRK